VFTECNFENQPTDALLGLQEAAFLHSKKGFRRLLLKVLLDMVPSNSANQMYFSYCHKLFKCTLLNISVVRKE